MKCCRRVIFGVSAALTLVILILLTLLTFFVEDDGEYDDGGDLLSSRSSTSQQAWKKYITDVYGADAPLSSQDGPAQFNWFYWSAPFAPSSLKIWILHFGNKQIQFPSNEQMKPGDGFVSASFKHSSAVGFRVFRNKEPSSFVLRDGTLWTEVMRHSKKKEGTVNVGAWHYQSRGTGIWFDLGHSILENSCFKFPDIRMRNVKKTFFGLSYEANQVGNTTVYQTQTCMANRCDPNHCLTNTSPPMERPVGVKGKCNTLLHSGITSALSWPPSRNRVFMKRSGDKEVIDCRHYGYRTGEYRTCGGARNLRTGWHASGGHCNCSDEFNFLNCRSLQKVIDRSIEIASKSAIRGRCDGEVITASSIIEFLEKVEKIREAKREGKQRACMDLYFEWPPVTEK